MDKGGRIHVAFDTYKAGNYVVMLRSRGRDGTLGATVATASAGPLSTAFGTPRDLVLGIEFVTGAAAIARGGGRVVKNVAGYDLARLFTGSWGTLGVITEVTVRLHARPAADVSFAVNLTRGADDVERVRAALRQAPFSPYACEILNEHVANALIGGGSDAVLFRLGGNTEAVAAQRKALEAIGVPREVDDGVWARIRAIEPENAIVFRLSKVGSEIARVWTEAQTLANGCPGAMIHARPARGIVRVIVPRDERSIEQLRSALAAPAVAKRVGERLPNELWPLIGPSATADDLSTRMKQAFDPRRVLNPGIFGEPS
jgi:glycolate oxidase FAD binding subunit